MTVLTTLSSRFSFQHRVVGSGCRSPWSHITPPRETGRSTLTAYQRETRRNYNTLRWQRNYGKRREEISLPLPKTIPGPWECLVAGSGKSKNKGSYSVQDVGLIAYKVSAQQRSVNIVIVFARALFKPHRMSCPWPSEVEDALVRLRVPDPLADKVLPLIQHITDDSVALVQAPLSLYLVLALKINFCSKASLVTDSFPLLTSGMNGFSLTLCCMQKVYGNLTFVQSLRSERLVMKRSRPSPVCSQSQLSLSLTNGDSNTSALMYRSEKRGSSGVGKLPVR